MAVAQLKQISMSAYDPLDSTICFQGIHHCFNTSNIRVRNLNGIAVAKACVIVDEVEILLVEIQALSFWDLEIELPYHKGWKMFSIELFDLPPVVLQIHLTSF